ncbi:potassium/proton antiporter [Sediminicurvatus halobius]|uniref:Potassium/proton antiporter n=1 Tax=Sediminicurvatus halobius TaxID=2182432 RepID=A0A2U2N225_9GAMM|nr:potassium/proton antiporter [Spiribacter halobius]PWG63113.1 potassium/proton antiporter [Spiribacter halobius]UEX77562.1 potassium/proton antiporter [Spiribacter halobius]
MEFANEFIFAAGALLALGILASIPSDRSGVPLLLVVLGLGMLAGQDGLLGIVFNDVATAHLLGTLALAIILFDGGLHTPLASFRTGLRPGLLLATAGVVVTAGLTAFALHGLFGWGWLEAWLMAAIISSTDAAAVFYLLRSRGLRLHDQVRNTLEIESGVNDPMAVFMVIALLEAMRTPEAAAWSAIATELLRQGGIGLAGGAVGGAAFTLLVNRLRLPASLNPLLALSGGLLVYGGTAVAGGSGFLAAYLAGLILGNRARGARHNIQRFHDGMAWLCQIGLFLMLGLLVTPGELPSVAGHAVFIAAFVILVARPAAVALCLLPLRFPWRHVLFVSWVGLRGAVPIVLALFPLLAGIASAGRDFNIAFFVVLISLLVQGWTVAPLARWLGLSLPGSRPEAQRLDLDRPVGHDLVICEVLPETPASRLRVGELRPPDGVHLLSILRDGAPRPPEADVELVTGDLLYLLVPATDPLLQERFQHWLDAVGTVHPAAEQAFFGDFTVDGEADMAALAEAYLGGAVADARPGETVGDYLARRLRRRPSEGDRVDVGGVSLVVREIDGGRIARVGLRLPHG